MTAGSCAPRRDRSGHREELHVVMKLYNVAPPYQLVVLATWAYQEEITLGGNGWARNQTELASVNGPPLDPKLTSIDPNQAF
jgi:hypothetical protein